MKTSEVISLKPGDLIEHRRYGQCAVVEVMMPFGSLFGVQIKPCTVAGKAQLATDSGVQRDIPFLEGNVRSLRHLPDSP